MRNAILMALLLLMGAGNLFGAEIQFSENAEVISIDYKGSSQSRDVITLRGAEHEAKLICNGHWTSLHVTSRQGTHFYESLDFYSNGCKQLLRQLIVGLGVKTGDSVDLNFIGPDVYSALVIEAIGQKLTYTPAGAGERSVFKETSRPCKVSSCVAALYR